MASFVCFRLWFEWFFAFWWILSILPAFYGI